MKDVTAARRSNNNQREPPSKGFSMNVRGLKLGLTHLLVTGATLVLLAGLVMPRVGAQVYEKTYPELRRELEETLPSKSQPHKEFPVPHRELPETITPCRACHGPENDFPVNYQRREALKVHTNLQLQHGGVRVWCLDCHHPKKRNYLLPLSDGELIEFRKSYLLCGKCHGTIFRDWRHGIHGRRTGHWKGPKTYYLCVHCHDPHSPKYKPLRPEPPPDKPRTPRVSQGNH
jgi:hypothetical protein